MDEQVREYDGQGCCITDGCARNQPGRLEGNDSKLAALPCETCSSSRHDWAEKVTELLLPFLYYFFSQLSGLAVR